MRAIKTLVIEAEPNRKTVLKCTRPSRKFLKAPTRLEIPTIKSEYDIAMVGEIPNKYTRMGMVKMEPPPPIIPMDMPMNKDAI